MRQKLGFLKSQNAILIIGILLGALTILAIRFVTYSPPEATHYHANLGVYINGERETFNDPRYYQEVAVCGGDGVMLPEQRAHLHGNENSVVHVHDEAVTWGQLFNNIGWTVGSDFIVTDSNTTYKEDAGNKLNIFINGQNFTDITNIANTVIKNTDRLLISYGTANEETLQQQADSVAATAAEFNTKPDPASCSAGKTDATLTDRFKNLL